MTSSYTRSPSWDGIPEQWEEWIDTSESLPVEPQVFQALDSKPHACQDARERESSLSSVQTEQRGAKEQIPLKPIPPKNLKHVGQKTRELLHAILQSSSLNKRG